MSRPLRCSQRPNAIDPMSTTKNATMTISTAIPAVYVLLRHRALALEELTAEVGANIGVLVKKAVN